MCLLGQRSWLGLLNAALEIIASEDPKAARILAAIKNASGVHDSKGRDIPIGLHILKNSNWYGTINLDDQADYSLTRSYMGRQTN